MQTDGILLAGYHGANNTNSIFGYDPIALKTVSTYNIETPYNDVEALSWPVACGVPPLPSTSPSPSPSPSASPTLDPTATPSASPTASPSATPSSTPTVTPTASPTPSPTAPTVGGPEATPTPTPTITPTPTPLVGGIGATSTPTPTPEIALPEVLPETGSLSPSLWIFATGILLIATASFLIL